MRLSTLVFAAAFACAPVLAAEPIDQDAWAKEKRVVKLDNGMRLAVVEYGDPKGKPVLLLHGFTDTSRSWTQLLPSLGEFRVIVPDQRGHGAASKPECCYTAADYAYDAKLLLDELGVERAAVAGHSLGSVIAAELAATYPERVERIALAGSTGLAPASRSHWLAEGALGLTDANGTKGEFVEAWFAEDSVVETPVDPAFLAHVAREGHEVPPHVWRGVIRGLIDVPVARLAADIKAPVLIIAGGKDTLFGPEHQAALRAAFPDAEYVEFDNLGHNMTWEETEKVAPPLVDFLRR